MAESNDGGFWEGVQEQYENGKEYVNDVTSDARDAGRDAAERAIPDELERLAELGSDQIDTLVAFAEGLEDFILGTILGSLVDWTFEGTAVLISAIQTALAPLVSTPATLAAPFMMAGRTMYASLASVISTLNATIVEVSMAAGPFSPVIVYVIWGLIAVVAIEAGRRAVEMIITEVLPLVIPWL